MFHRALLLGLVAIAILPAGAQNVTVVSRSGPFGQNLSWWNSGIANTQYVSWTQAAGTQFSSVQVFAALCSSDGNPATGMAYLTNNIGGSATSANQIGSAVSFTIPGTSICQSNPQVINQPFQLDFGGVNLPAASTATTYYLVVYDTSANLGWIFTSTATVEEACDTTSSAPCPNGGVSTNTDGLGTISPPVPPNYPPSAGFSTPSPNKAILFAVTGNVGIPTTTVPTLSPWGLGGATLLLLASGLFLMRRHNSA